MSPGLHPDELRELHPAELILECAGVRHAPPFGGDALERLRSANRRLRSAAGDPAAAAGADAEFRRLLTDRCGNPRLLAVIEPLRRQLAPYERVRLADAGRVARTASQHDEIIAALERRDHRAAERRLRAHRTTALRELVAGSG